MSALRIGGERRFGQFLGALIVLSSGAGLRAELPTPLITMKILNRPQRMPIDTSCKPLYLLSRERRDLLLYRSFSFRGCPSPARVWLCSGFTAPRREKRATLLIDGPHHRPFSAHLEHRHSSCSSIQSAPAREQALASSPFFSLIRADTFMHRLSSSSRPEKRTPGFPPVYGAPPPNCQELRSPAILTVGRRNSFMLQYPVKRWSTTPPAI